MNSATPLTKRGSWNALVRRDRLGETGDAFTVEVDGERFRYVLLAVERVPLGFVADYLYSYAGVDEPEGVVESWSSEHGGFEPDDDAWLHLLAREGRGDRLLRRLWKDWYSYEREERGGNRCGWCGSVLPTSEALGGHKSGCRPRKLWTGIMSAVEREVQS